MYLKNKSYLGILFIAPALIYLIFFYIYPIFNGMLVSLFKTGSGVIARESFEGIGNYIRIFQDARGVKSIYITFIYTVGTVVLNVLIGIILALCLNEVIRFRKFFRMILILPWTVSGVVAALTWRWLFSSQFGLINDILMRIGIIDEGINWLSNTNLALFSVIIATVWREFPFVMIMALASLQTVKPEQYDSAAIDGVNEWQKFWYITWPNINVIVMPVILLDFIWMFQYFDLISTMTGGGPAQSTETMPIYIYKAGFKYFQFGYSSSIGVFLFAIVFIVSVFYMKIYSAESQKK